MKKGQKQAGQGDSCPVMKKKVYNVYSQEIDPSNNMPAVPNQGLEPNQAYKLSTDRVNSNIPKGGTDSTWTYPSPQMFYNALKRKGKGDDVTEHDVQVIVDIHNNMNESTWDEVMKYEKLHAEECPEPMLLKFCGKPDDLSPKARLKNLFGWPAPFDRHDWTVDRNGTEVRYIIDYYHNDEEDGDIRPTLETRGAVKSITLDVRPALESFGALQDRAVMTWRELSGSTEAPTGIAPEKIKDSDHAPIVLDVEWKAGLDQESLHLYTNRINRKCGKHQEAIKEGADPNAHFLMQLCMAGVVCPDQQKAYLDAAETGKGEDVANEKLWGCLQDFGKAVAKVKAEKKPTPAPVSSNSTGERYWEGVPPAGK